MKVENYYFKVYVTALNFVFKPFYALVLKHFSDLKAFIFFVTV